VQRNCLHAQTGVDAKSRWLSSQLPKNATGGSAHDRPGYCSNSGNQAGSSTKKARQEATTTATTGLLLSVFMGKLGGPEPMIRGALGSIDIRESIVKALAKPAHCVLLLLWPPEKRVPP
jgi:hypothetical protein